MAEKTLSVFIDESGDFGPYDYHAPYYIVTMVLHEQVLDISEDIARFSSYLTALGYEEHALHAGPLIRRESVYSNDMMEDRKHLFNALFNFTRRLDIHYICTVIKKSECADVIAMTSKLSKEIAGSLRKHEEYFSQFDKIILYYDNGQVELTKILTSVFNTLFSHVDIRKVQPIDYKLFQVADLVCTMELLSLKAEGNQFSNSETEFFHSIREFKKGYLKGLRKKEL